MHQISYEDKSTKTKEYHMESAKAQFELIGLHAKAQDLQEVDFVTQLTNKGLPQEIITRLQSEMSTHFQTNGFLLSA